MDPLKFLSREQGPETGLVRLRKCYSKTRIDKNPGRAPSDAHPTSQQKRHPVWSALKNGGAENFDGALVLRPDVRGCNSLFIRQLTGKKQAFEKFIHWILKHCWNSIPLLRNIRQNPPNSLLRVTGNVQGKIMSRLGRIVILKKFVVGKNSL